METDKIILLKTRYDEHVSVNTILELEEVFIKTFNPKQVLQQPFRKLLKQLYRLPNQSNLLRKIFHKLFSVASSTSNYFVVLMGIEQIRKSYPYFLFTAKSKSIYLFDCWEKNFTMVEEAVIRHNIRTIFFSAEQSADFFQKKFPGRNCIWVPEGIIVSKYRTLPFEKKTIDLIQIGRRYNEYHTAIASFCEGEKIKYVFEKVKGEVIFPDQNDFYNALAQSKISICFPSSLTHPERSGKISTMTVRYLQSMASGCLIVGRMPEDMKLLFDYCPIIEADMKDPTLQIQTILSNYKDYWPLIEKNYYEVISKHQWVNRMEIFKKYV